MTERTKTVIAIHMIKYYLNQQATGSGPLSTSLAMGQYLVTETQLMNVINGRRK